MKRMKYSLYKGYYSEFPAVDYDPKTKTILADIPDVKRKAFPREWKRDGNHYYTPGGCEVVFWNTGLSESFEVVRYKSCFDSLRKSVYPCIDAREKVMQIVADFESR